MRFQTITVPQFLYCRDNLISEAQPMFSVTMSHTFEVLFRTLQLCSGFYWIYLCCLEHSIANPEDQECIQINHVDSKESTYQAL